MTARPLTLNQQTTLTAIRGYIGQHDGVAPTFQELADVLAVSKISAFESCRILRDKGWITMEYRKTRSIRIVGRCSECGRESGVA